MQKQGNRILLFPAGAKQQLPFLLQCRIIGAVESIRML